VDARTQEIVAHAVAIAVKAALAAQTPPLPPAADLPAWCSTAEYAKYIGKAVTTIRDYARRAPPALRRKYGRDWRLAGPAFDAWVRTGGPFRQRKEDSWKKVH